MVNVNGEDVGGENIYLYHPILGGVYFLKNNVYYPGISHICYIQCVHSYKTTLSLFRIFSTLDFILLDLYMSLPISSLHLDT